MLEIAVDLRWDSRYMVSVFLLGSATFWIVIMMA